MIEVLANHKVDRAIMSCHRFPHSSGVMYQTKGKVPEVRYQRAPGGKVKMFAAGNCGNYEHDALDWLQAGQINLPNGCSMVWYKI